MCRAARRQPAGVTGRCAVLPPGLAPSAVGSCLTQRHCCSFAAAGEALPTPCDPRSRIIHTSASEVAAAATRVVPCTLISRMVANEDDTINCPREYQPLLGAIIDSGSVT